MTVKPTVRRVPGTDWWEVTWKFAYSARFPSHAEAVAFAADLRVRP